VLNDNTQCDAHVKNKCSENVFLDSTILDLKPYSSKRI
jgi:hypothetical protein